MGGGSGGSADCVPDLLECVCERVSVYDYELAYISVRMCVYVCARVCMYVKTNNNRHICTLWQRMHMCTYDTGWRRYIEGLKLHISFRKNAINYRALLQKMT